MTDRDIRYCLKGGIPREEIIKAKDEEIIAEICEVLRDYNNVIPRITSSEAIKRIKEIVKEDPD